MIASALLGRRARPVVAGRFQRAMACGTLETCPTSRSKEHDGSLPGRTDMSTRSLTTPRPAPARPRPISRRRFSAAARSCWPARPPAPRALECLAAGDAAGEARRAVRAVDRRALRRPPARRAALLPRVDRPRSARRWPSSTTQGHAGLRAGRLHRRRPGPEDRDRLSSRRSRPSTPGSAATAGTCWATTASGRSPRRSSSTPSAQGRPLLARPRRTFTSSPSTPATAATGSPTGARTSTGWTPTCRRPSWRGWRPT